MRPFGLLIANDTTRKLVGKSAEVPFKRISSHLERCGTNIVKINSRQAASSSCQDQENTSWKICVKGQKRTNLTNPRDPSTKWPWRCNKIGLKKWKNIDCKHRNRIRKGSRWADVSFFTLICRFRWEFDGNEHDTSECDRPQTLLHLWCGWGWFALCSETGLYVGRRNQDQATTVGLPRCQTVA